MQPLLLLQLELTLVLVLLLTVVVVEDLTPGAQVDVLLPQDVDQVHVLRKHAVVKLPPSWWECEQGLKQSQRKHPCCGTLLVRLPRPVPQYLLPDNNTGTNVKREGERPRE